MTRVKVFIDYQNAYSLAREAFGNPDVDIFTFGQVSPRRLGVLLKTNGEAVDAQRELTEVRVYRGEPSAKHSPVGQRACQRQVRFWDAQAAVMSVSRPLHYRPIAWDRGGRPTRWEVREKGIDVLIAIDMVMGAVRDEYDVAVLVSADTDLVPALEAVLMLDKRVEVASWRPEHGWGKRLNVQGQNLWCHWLERADFDHVRDDTDYTRSVEGRPEESDAPRPWDSPRSAHLQRREDVLEGSFPVPIGPAFDDGYSRKRTWIKASTVAGDADDAGVALEAPGRPIGSLVVDD